MTDTDTLRELLDWHAANGDWITGKDFRWVINDDDMLYENIAVIDRIELSSTYFTTSAYLIHAAKRRAEAMGLDWEATPRYVHLFEPGTMSPVVRASGLDEAANWLTALKALKAATEAQTEGETDV